MMMTYIVTIKRFVLISYIMNQIISTHLTTKINYKMFLDTQLITKKGKTNCCLYKKYQTTRGMVMNIPKPYKQKKIHTDQHCSKQMSTNF